MAIGVGRGAIIPRSGGYGGVDPVTGVPRGVPGQTYQMPSNTAPAPAPQPPSMVELSRQQYQSGAPSASAVGSAAAQAGNQSQYGFSVDPHGYASMNNDAEQGRVTDRMRADLEMQAAQQARRWQVDDRNDFIGRIGGSYANPQARVERNGIQGDEAAARASAFARAKDMAGRIARSSLSSIAEEMASKGISGGGWQALKSAGAISSATAPVQELVRDQMMQDYNRAASISDQSYQGDITQRGQDLQNRDSYFSLLRGLY